MTMAEAVNVYNRANAHRRSGNHTEAEKDYTQALHINPELSEAYNNRGNARRNLGNNVEAIEDYTQALHINPELAEAYNNRGNARRSLGDIPGAIEDYNQAIHINSRLAEAYNNRGNAYSSLGDKASAIDNYNQAIQINSSLAEAYNNRAVNRYQIDDEQGALEDFTQAVYINANYTRAYVNRSIVRADLGDKQAALEDLREAAKLFSCQGYPDKSERLQQIIVTVESISSDSPKLVEQMQEALEGTVQPAETTSDLPENLPALLETPYVVGSQLVKEVKKIIKAGNVRRILIKNTEDKTLFEIPLAFGALTGAGLIFLAPELVAVGAVAAFMAHVKIVVER